MSINPLAGVRSGVRRLPAEINTARDCIQGSGLYRAWDYIIPAEIIAMDCKECCTGPEINNTCCGNYSFRTPAKTQARQRVILYLLSRYMWPEG